APRDALARQDARLEAVGDALVLAEQVAGLAAAHADVTGRAGAVLADVAERLGHERLAEAHDLAVGPPGRVEVRAALGTTDRHAREGVLEDLLEAEELHDPEVHRGVEAQAALERAESGVELDAKAPVDLDATGVVDPRDAEDDLPLGLADALEHRGIGVVGVLAQHGTEALEDLAHRLVELGLTRVACQDLGVDGFKRGFHANQSAARAERVGRRPRLRAVDLAEGPPRGRRARIRLRAGMVRGATVRGHHASPVLARTTAQQG